MTKAAQKAGVAKISLSSLSELAEKDVSVKTSLENLSNLAIQWHRATQGKWPEFTPTKSPVQVTVTGAAGQIGYALLFRVASGEMLGPDQPVILRCLELPNAMNALEGVKMELNDCAFPLLKNVVCTSDPEEAFDGTDFALLVGAKPRGPGMERKDLLQENGKLFTTQGKALNKASKRARVVVVGNPANTNALIAANSATKLSPENFSALMRLDHNRGLAQLAEKAKCEVTDIERFVVWGNHSSTQYPDISHTQIKGKWAKEVINDDKWVKEVFLPTVQQRGAAVIKARGSSSAASAANATIEHMRDWVHGTNGHWTSMAVYSNGSYGATKGIYFSYPIVCEGGEYTIVQNVPIDPYSAQKIEASHKELLQERDAVSAYLKN